MRDVTIQFASNVPSPPSPKVFYATPKFFYASPPVFLCLPQITIYVVLSYYVKNHGGETE